MEDKINSKAVDKYSKAFADKVSGSFFSNKETISGPEILNLCQIRQVNLFVIRDLMRSWQKESQKLKSPYFNYNSNEVREALTQFQNVLSNHISISKDFFVPVLSKAVHQTIMLALDPYDFYSDTLDKESKAHIKVAELKNEIKYLKINCQPLEKLVAHLEEKKLEIISGNEAFALLDHILEEVNFTPEDVDAYLTKFSEVIPTSVEMLYESATVSVPKKIRQQVPSKEVKTIADDFQKIQSIKEKLTINQKFMFTKILFSGDFDLFTQTIDQLDNFDSLKQATQYLETNYTLWDRESEEYEEFLQLVEKRFS
ncbi:MAG: hypothetical protein JJE09_14260 [Bacteroidia bacterium]|nr:hypothetical protein [Bacteroidia bacterium]